jgi:hypothetical protein
MRLVGIVAGVMMAVFMAGSAFAQSSGSFSASYDATQCAISSSTGALTSNSGATVPGNLGTVTMKVSSGSGTGLVITPSLVTGLFTDNKISSNNSSSTQNVGILVTVEVDGSTTSVVPELGSDGVIYDQRFIQVTSAVISGLASCQALAGATCFELVESTLAAHSFNFYISGLSTGTHDVTVSWTLIGGTNGEGACVGPGTLTVTQVKNFNFNTPIAVQ